MHKPSLFLIAIGICMAPIQAQIKVDSIGLNRLNGGLKALSLDADLTHASWGFCLMDPATGKVISDYNSDRSLMPASSMKVVTTISALNLLGEDYTYSTRIEYDGTLSPDGLLTGNIYIKGSGDPSLGSERIDSSKSYEDLVAEWAKAIQKKGINHITGHIIADQSAFEYAATPGSWNWDDIGQYYGAGPYGLNVNENAYTIYYSSTDDKSKIDSIVPAIDGIHVRNDVTVAGSGDEAYIYGAPESYDRYVTGSIPANRKKYAVDGSMPDPPLFLANALKKALNTAGVVTDQPATTVYAMEDANQTVNNDRILITQTVSPPLSELVFHTNQKSVNLYAEAFLKTIGLEKISDGSKSAGIKVVRSYLSDKGLDVNGFNMDDGCGLSRMDVITPKQMCSLLTYETKQPTFQAFRRSLPVAGESGTLKTVGDNTVAQGKVFAKSGSMYKVRSYSGYVLTKSGEWLSFCVIVNNYTCGTAEIRTKLEKLMVWMVGV